MRKAWLLPEGVSEQLPPEALRIERLRRDALDCLATWGYQLVMPPLVEYLDSLLTGVGSDLDLETFKLTDALSGRLLGVRADITPQVARIDAHRLQNHGPNRLCYVGPVLHTQSRGLWGDRNPLQLGAELYGHAGIASDREILRLSLQVLRLAGHGSPLLNLSHMGVFQGLMELLKADADEARNWSEIFRRKDQADCAAYAASRSVPTELADALQQLLLLQGGTEVVDRARALLRVGNATINAALSELEALCESTSDAEVHVDFAALRGFDYHTGLIFEAYIPGSGEAVAFGGRYDEIGEVFGRARPATGFSVDLKRLVSLAPVEQCPRRIFAPWSEQQGLQDVVAELRSQGEIVVEALGADTAAATDGCDHELVFDGGAWSIVAVNRASRTEGSNESA